MSCSFPRKLHYKVHPCSTVAQSSLSRFSCLLVVHRIGLLQYRLFQSTLVPQLSYFTSDCQVCHAHAIPTRHRVQLAVLLPPALSPRSRCTCHEAELTMPYTPQEMSKSSKPSLAARIFPPPNPPKTHSPATHAQSHNPSATTAIGALTIQEPAPVAPGPFHRRSYAYQTPIVSYDRDRDERAQREQTAESERARDALLKHGIKVRDFQVEADARRSGNGNAGGSVGGKRST